MDVLGLMVLAFLIGSIPFGVLLAKLFSLPDPRSVGSGNIGATNMLRTGRKDIAAATLMLDAIKGAIPILLVHMRYYDFNLLILLCAVLGHCFSPWLGFKGGKGVATCLGGLIAFNPVAGFLTCAVWLCTFAGTKISSLSALVAIALSPFFVGWQEEMPRVMFMLLITSLIFYRHKDNITRLVRGEEPTFGEKKDGDDDAA